MACGIYSIYNSITDKCYIGSSTDIARRLSKHRCSLGRGSHQNTLLQNSWNKHGEENFTVKVLLYCAQEDLLFYEQRAIDRYLAHKGVYNIRLVAESNFGLRHTEDAKKRISEKLTGIKRPPRTQEHKDRLSKSLTGRKGNKGYTATPETCAKISKSLTGKTQSPESRAKRSLSMMGRATALGCKHSAEANRKKSILQKGKVTSAETKKKMSVAAKKRHKASQDKKLKEAEFAK